MKYIRADVNIIFDKKPLFYEKITPTTIFVSVPCEWNKDRIDRFIAEAARSLVKNTWPVSKKRTVNVIVKKKSLRTIFNEGTKFYEYDFDDKHGKWERWERW